jgi:hypothetical protein
VEREHLLPVTQEAAETAHLFMAVAVVVLLKSAGQMGSLKAAMDCNHQ